MRIKIFWVLTVICISIGLASCNKADNKSLAAEHADAYFAVFQKIYEEDAGLNADSKYIAIDLTGAKLSDTSRLIEQIQGFCDDNGYELLQDTFNGLKEKGYIKDSYFEDGFLISLNNIELSKDTLVTTAQKWRSGIGAISVDYTVKKKSGSWVITKTENMMMS